MGDPSGSAQRALHPPVELLGIISESIARGAPAVATRDHSIRGRVDILTWRRSGKHRLDRLHAIFGTLLSPPATAVLSILIQHAIHHLRLVWCPAQTFFHVAG